MNNNIKQIFDIMNAKEHTDENRNKSYMIPMYQRGYRWELNQVISLLDDVHRNSVKYADNLEKAYEERTGYEYCIQPLVLKKSEKEDEGYIVIDGQQRLTTFSLIFYALNQLEKEIKKENITSHEPQDEILIKYDRTGEISEIPKMCANLPWPEVGAFSFQDIETEDLYKNNKIIDNLREETNKLIMKQTNFDYQFMINNYVYLYLFFRSIVLEKGASTYFEYLNNEKRENVTYYSERLKQLRSIFKYEVSVIWYEPDSNDEENIFEKFNATKIALTKSELVKALFMNPDNYIAAGQNDYSNEAIKVRQISIGVEWDSIERQLYNEELWFFIPHKKEHNSAKFDAILDMLVYFEYKKDPQETKKSLQHKFEDPLFSFKELEKWIKQELKDTKNSDEKASVMKKWWKKIRELFEWYSDIFAAIDYSSNANKGTSMSYSIFHRISLIQLMQELYFSNITNGNPDEKYIEALDKNYKILFELGKVGAGDFRKRLNELIKEEISVIWKNDNTTVFLGVEKDACDTLDKKIRALVYEKGRKRILMRIFHVIFSLDIQEETVGSISRFSFKEFTKKDEKKDGQKDDMWILEHIFAKGTDFVNLDQSEKDNILKVLQDCGWKEYIEFKYKDILTIDKIERIINVKKDLIDLIQTCKTSIPPEIWEPTQTDYAADVYEHNVDNRQSWVVDFLKDNSMGNMGIIPKGVNSSVGNKSFIDKQDEIRKHTSSGEFIPIGTNNVFNGVYADKNFAIDYWYPIHRKVYLEQIIKRIDHYLEK